MNRNKLFCAALICAFAGVFQCSKGPTQTADGGTSSEVVGKILKENGTPAANTQVKLLPTNYNPAADTAFGETNLRTDTTDESGSYVFDSLQMGQYNIEAIHISERTRLLIQQLDVNGEGARNIPDDTLKRPGSIRISLSQTGNSPTGYLYIPGTSIFVPVEKGNVDSGYAVLDSVPAGLISRLRYVASADTASAIVAQDVSVEPGQTVEVRQTMPKAIYYSVGIRTDALYTGTASAQGGILSLDSPAPDNVGVGDELRVSENRFYISRRNSSISFSIQTATGAPAQDFGQQSISIYRAFDHLNTALMAEFGVVCAADSSHLNTADLSSGNYQLFIACYGDGVDDQQASIRGWSTSPINYIKIYTPVSDTEAGISQRHKGVWNAAGAYAIHIIADGSGSAGINCVAPHVRIDGLQVWIESQYADGTGIMYYEQGNGEFDVSNSIVRATLNAPLGSGVGVYVYTHSGNGPYIRFWNNIIHGFADTTSAGIQIQLNAVSGMIANNTLVNCHLGVVGWLDNIVLRNNLAQCTYGFDSWGRFNVNNDYNVSSSKEWDLAAVHSRDSVFVSFVDAAKYDFHLAAGDTVVKDQGMTNPVPMLFSNDIDGQIRIAPWDVGADEVN